MTALAQARAANAAYSPSYLPVAIFVGGTSGIGQATAQAFAQHTKGNAHIILIGRNREAAESIMATFPTPTSTGKYEFVQCDATLMKNVQTTTKELLGRLPKINYLFASTGILTMKGRYETSEGLDKKLAVHYYARWKFANDLMPLLTKAKADGEDASMTSVLAAGHGGTIDLDDLGLKKGYSLSAAATAATTYNDLMVEACIFVNQSVKLYILMPFEVILRLTSRHTLHPHIPRYSPHPPRISNPLGPQAPHPAFVRAGIPYFSLAERMRGVHAACDVEQ